MEKILKLILALAVGCSAALAGCDNDDDSQKIPKERGLVKIEAYSVMPDYILPELPRDFSKYRLKIRGENYAVDTVLGKIAEGIMLPVGYYSFDLEYHYKDTIQTHDNRDVPNNKVVHSHLRYQGLHKEYQKCHMVKCDEPNVYSLGVTIAPTIVDWCDKPIDECDYGKVQK